MRKGTVIEKKYSSKFQKMGFVLKDCDHLCFGKWQIINQCKELIQLSSMFSSAWKHPEDALSSLFGAGHGITRKNDVLLVLVGNFALSDQR
jgi:hypothetical protein